MGSRINAVQYTLRNHLKNDSENHVLTQTFPHRNDVWLKRFWKIVPWSNINGAYLTWESEWWSILFWNELRRYYSVESLCLHVGSRECFSVSVGIIRFSVPVGMHGPFRRNLLERSQGRHSLGGGWLIQRPIAHGARHRTWSCWALGGYTSCLYQDDSTEVCMNRTLNFRWVQYARDAKPFGADESEPATAAEHVTSSLRAAHDAADGE